MSEIITRIVSLLDNSGMTAKELTEKLNLNRSTISDWKIGKTKPSVNAVIGISQIFDVSLDWLLTGKETDATETNMLGTIGGTELITKEEPLLLLLATNFRALSSAGQIMLANQSAVLLDKEKNEKVYSYKIASRSGKINTLEMTEEQKQQLLKNLEEARKLPPEKDLY